MRDCKTGRRARTGVRTRHQHGSSSRSSPGAASTSGPAERITDDLVSIGLVIDRRTVSRHLTRLGLGKRRFIDPGGENNRKPGKITARRPGHMVHLDVKKVGRIPDGRGCWIHGRDNDQAKVANRAIRPGRSAAELSAGRPESQTRNSAKGKRLGSSGKTSTWTPDTSASARTVSGPSTPTAVEAAPAVENRLLPPEATDPPRAQIHQVPRRTPNDRPPRPPDQAPPSAPRAAGQGTDRGR